MKVTQERINSLIENAEVKEFVVFDKCLICAYKLQNGFIIVEHSACVDPNNFDIDTGREICREHLENELWELEGYVCQEKFAKKTESIQEQIDRKRKELSPEGQAIYDQLLGVLQKNIKIN